MLFQVVSGTVQSQLKVWLRDGPLEKLGGGGGIFEPQEFFFSLSNSLHEYFFRINWCAQIFSLNFPLRENFFLYFEHPRPHPPHKFSNGPPITLIQISSQGHSVAEIRKRKNGGSDLQRMVARTQKKI